MLLTGGGAPGLVTGFGSVDPALGAAGLAAPPERGSPFAFNNTAFSQHSLI